MEIKYVENNSYEIEKLDGNPLIQRKRKLLIKQLLIYHYQENTNQHKNKIKLNKINRASYM